jgi:hypothetical protein
MTSTTNSDIKPGIYTHSKKGTLYRVIGVALHSETLEPMVVYEALYDNPTSKLWVRPASMWNEIVEIEGKKVPRFVFVKEA